HGRNQLRHPAALQGRRRGSSARCACTARNAAGRSTKPLSLISACLLARGAGGTGDDDGGSRKTGTGPVRARFPSAGREGEQQTDQAERDAHGDEPDDELEPRAPRVVALLRERLVEARVAASDLSHAGACVKVVVVAFHGLHHGASAETKGGI